MAKPKNKNDIPGLIFVGCMFIGAGVGFLTGQLLVGGAIGMGTGFLMMASYLIITRQTQA